MAKFKAIIKIMFFFFTIVIDELSQVFIWFLGLFKLFSNQASIVFAPEVRINFWYFGSYEPHL